MRLRMARLAYSDTMKRLVLPALLVSLSLPAYKISTEDQTILVNHLQKTAKELHEAVKGLSAAQFQFKAGPDRWSVAECLEHITISEGFLREIATGKTMKLPATPEGIAERRKNDRKILAAITDRTRKGRAPEPLKPLNKFATPKATLDAFDKARKETIAFVKTTNADLRAHASPHWAVKEADAYQWLLYLSGHSERHTKQILEVKADPNFPKQ
jgi:hypothetical protein